MSIVRYGIDKLRTTPYKPYKPTNQVERLHRTINAVLGKTVAEHQKDCDIRLPYVMVAYRATRHESTGYSPNFLMMCRETYSAIDVVYERPDTESSQTYDGFIEDIRDRMIHVRDTLQRSAERNKRYYDLKVRSYKYNKGDWVYYFNTRGFQRKQMKMGTAVYRAISNNPDAESTYSGNPKKPKSEGNCSAH